MKTGEPQTHKDSANSVCKIIESDIETVSTQRRVIEFPDGYRHEFDVVISRITHVIEVGDIGDDSKHNPGHKSQLINDGIAKAHIEKYMPNVKYVKINKDDCHYPFWVSSKL